MGITINKVSNSELVFRIKKLKKDEIRISRTAFINSIEELDINNIGCHFSANLSYIHEGGGSNGVTDRNKKLLVRIISIAKRDQILEEATEISNEGFTHEKEYVIKPN